MKKETEKLEYGFLFGVMFTLIIEMVTLIGMEVF